MTTDFTVNFGGDSHEIDLNALITALVNFSSAIQEIQQEVAPEAKVDIKVRPPEKGSFLIDLLLSTPDTDTIIDALLFFNKENLNIVENILSIFANSINLKQHLRGDKPKSIVRNPDNATISVENNYGQIVVFNNATFNINDTNPKIDNYISKAFAAIEKDTSVENIKIKNKKGRILSEVKESSFVDMSKIGYVPETPPRRIIIKESVNIRAYKLSFDENSKWGFIYEGDKITALISDINFLKSIDENESFAKGDILTVDLQIIQEYDKSVQDYLNKTYEVIKLKNHVRANKQGKLF